MSNHAPCGKTLLNRSELHRKLQVKYHLSYQNRNKTKPQKPKHTHHGDKDNLHRYLTLLEKSIFTKKNRLTDKDDIAKALRLQQIFWRRRQNGCSSSNLCFPTIL